MKNPNSFLPCGMLLILVSCFFSCSPGNLVYYTFEEFPLGVPNYANPNSYIVNNKPTGTTKGQSWYWYEGETIILENESDYPLRIVEGTELPGKALRYNCNDPEYWKDVKMSFFAKSSTINPSDTITFSWMGIPHLNSTSAQPFVVGGNLDFPSNLEYQSIFNVQIKDDQLYVASWDQDDLEYQALTSLANAELHLVIVRAYLSTQTISIRLETSQGASDFTDIPFLAKPGVSLTGTSLNPCLHYYWETDYQTNTSYYLIDQVRIQQN